MKKSEILREQSRSEDNNIKSFSLLNKSFREERLERFILHIDSLISKGYEIKEDNNKYTIDGTSFGIIDYFPKANTILIRKKNKWINSGFSWISKNL